MSKEEEVIEFIAKKTCIAPEKITPDKSFYDLGTDGDDAVELVDELCERYKVDIEGLDLSRYIGPEAGFGVVSHLFNALTRKRSAERKDLKIGDLIKTAEDGRWFETIPAQNR
jgi:acyl carrier protein